MRIQTMRWARVLGTARWLVIDGASHVSAVGGRGVFGHVPLAVAPNAVRGDERHEQVIIELGQVAGDEAAGTDRLLLGRVYEFVVHVTVSADVVVAGKPWCR